MTAEHVREQADKARRHQPGAKHTADASRGRRTNGRASAAPSADPATSTPSEDAVALAFVEQHEDHRFVVPTHQWLRWDGRRWCRDSAGQVYQRIRELVRSIVHATKAERTTANAAFISGVERLLRTDPRIALLPEQLDADPWALNTHSGIVDLRSGVIAPHDPARLCTRLAGAAVDANAGADLWSQFLIDITQGDAELQAYLQRVAGYCATGATSEDVLVYLFGIGANGKGSFAEAIAHALGDYAKTAGQLTHESCNLALAGGALAAAHGTHRPTRAGHRSFRLRSRRRQAGRPRATCGCR